MEAERTLLAAGAQKADQRPKLLRFLGLANSAAKPKSGAKRDRPRQGADRDAARDPRHDPGTRLGDDPEELHQLRVAARRLRAFLRAAGRCSTASGPAAPGRAQVARRRARSALRDLDVLLEHLRGGRGARRRRARRRAASQLEAERAARASGCWTRSRASATCPARRARGRSRGPGSRADAPLAKLARTSSRGSRRPRARWRPTPPTTTCTIRVRGKRARYSTELASAVAGERGAVITRAKASRT